MCKSYSENLHLLLFEPHWPTFLRMITARKGYLFIGVCLSTGGRVWHARPLPPRHAYPRRAYKPLSRYYEMRSMSGRYAILFTSPCKDIKNATVFEGFIRTLAVLSLYSIYVMIKRWIAFKSFLILHGCRILILLEMRSNGSFCLAVVKWHHETILTL